MRYIELFAGIGGFRMALDKAGHECVWANDIDKHAIAIYNNYYGEKYEPKDIRAVKGRDIPEHDLLCAGFPCVSFSIAGKRRGFKDTRGTLFFEVARIIRDKRPKMVLLENVDGLLSAGIPVSTGFYKADKGEGKGEITDNISRVKDEPERSWTEITVTVGKGYVFTTIINTLRECGYDVQWQILNSKNHGVPQNRNRVFIVGVLRGHGGRKVFPIGQDDRKVDEKEPEKRLEQAAQCLRARDYANWNRNFVMPKVAGCLTGGGHSGGLHSDMTVIPVQEKDMNYFQGDVSGKGYKSQQDKVYDIDGVMCTLPHSNPTNKLNIAVPVLTPDRLDKQQNGRRFKEDGEEMFTLTAQDRHGIIIKPVQLGQGKDSRAMQGDTCIGNKDEAYTIRSGNPNGVLTNQKIRRLTPKECYRLQGFCPRLPDESFDDTFYEKAKEVASPTQIYKTAGNAVTVNVIDAIVKAMDRSQKPL